MKEGEGVGVVEMAVVEMAAVGTAAKGWAGSATAEGRVEGLVVVVGREEVVAAAHRLQAWGVGEAASEDCQSPTSTSWRGCDAVQPHHLRLHPGLSPLPTRAAHLSTHPPSMDAPDFWTMLPYTSIYRQRK